MSRRRQYQTEKRPVPELGRVPGAGAGAGGPTVPTSCGGADVRALARRGTRVWMSVIRAGGEMLRVPALPGTPPSPKETAGLAEPCAQGSPALPTVSSTALSSQGSDRQEKLWVAQDTSTTSRGVKGLAGEASVATPPGDALVGRM